MSRAWLWPLTLGGVALVSALLVGVARADDTDIYVGRIPPLLSQPMVMFSIDAGPGLSLPYAQCAKVGTGTSMCAAAKWFKDNCPSCALPAADKPLTNYDAMRFAIRMVTLEVTGVKIGLIISHNHEPNCAGPGSALRRCSNGAYIARGLEPVDKILVPLTNQAIPGPNLSEFLSIVDSIPVPGGRNNHPYQGKEIYFELFRYLTGQSVYNGHNGYIDYATNSLNNLNVDDPAVDWDTTVEVPLLNRYISPLTVDLKCSKVFMVNFQFTPSIQDGDSDAAITSTNAGGMHGITLPGRPGEDFAAMIGYLRDVDLARDVSPLGLLNIEGKQNVTSYFFNPPTPLNSDPPQFDRTQLDNAQAGGTIRPLPFSPTPSILVDALRSVMSQILSVSTTFVAASVPVNVFNRTQTLDSVFMALFQPDPTLKLFWPGNLKKLKLKVFEVPCPPENPDCVKSREARLIDALGQDAVANDGRIKYDALTFWTDGNKIPANPAKGVIAGRDGRHVEQGGAGQQMPGIIGGVPGLGNGDSGARQLYVYPGVGTTLIPLNADLSAATALLSPLGALGVIQALPLLKFARGYDAFDQDGDLNLTEVRPWLMGDPLHSRPLAVNYGAINGHSRENPAIYVAMATNDGFLHYFRNTNPSGTQESGKEVWGFLPVEVLGILDKLAINNVLKRRLLGFDGAPTAYVKDVDFDGNIEPADGDKVWLYVGMRRGGRSYYALDVTDPTVPKLLWRIDRFTAGFTELGYTFSQPRVGEIQTGADSFGRPIVKPAVFFAGGYDPNKDYPDLVAELLSGGLPSAGTVGTNDSMGNAIYVVDAQTGALIWKAVKGSTTGPTSDPRVFNHSALTDSIPSDLTVLDSDGNGSTDRIVVGDAGGNVWRADLGPDTDGLAAPTLTQVTDDWKLVRLARLGRHAGPTKLNDRRFFHEPDLVQSRDEYGSFDGVLIGSGDREDPLDYGRTRPASGPEVMTENGFYMIKDRRVGVYAASDADPDAVVTPDMLADLTSNCLQAGPSEDCNPSLANGWRLRLLAGPGEKALASPLTAAHRVFFSTYVPKDYDDTTSCGPSEGSGLFYAVDLKKGTAAFNYNTADGGTAEMPNSAADRAEPLTSAGIPSEGVYVNLADVDGNEVKCVLGADLQCRAVPGATRFRTFWNRVE